MLTVRYNFSKIILIGQHNTYIDKG